jgi:uncharacterized membrane protein
MILHMFGPRFLLLTIILLSDISGVSAATIHGVVYEWSSFEPMDNALVEVNSTPVQFRVAISGVYSFNLPPGNYLITTSYYNNDTLEYCSEEAITLNDMEGDFVFDILLFPLQEEEEYLPGEDIANITINGENEGILPAFGWTYTAGALVTLFIIIAGAYYFGRKDQVAETKPAYGAVDPQIQVTQTPVPLPDDLKEIIELIKNAGGRITQKELRKKLNCSEAKVSLMISDLENRGWVQKIKKGRGNIILLNKI